ncbi:hypothetical protein [Propionivibrio sp.]|uniref:hypothetical protein n=1 Tax=Propionivibrio sp. TaxID=2212460 RepID=UPI003BF30CE6
MANRLKPLFCMALMLVLSLLTKGVVAQTVLTDPTRPPVSISAPAQDAGEVAGSVLQLVKLTKKGKPVAVIGGQLVMLGGLYGESRLIKLNEREAVLEGPAGIERLRLTPGIEKTNIIISSPSAKRAQIGSKPFI